MQIDKLKKSGENEKVVNANLTLYTVTDNKLLPNQIKILETPTPLYSLCSDSIFDSSLRLKTSFDEYDEKGNLIQYHTKDNFPISIKWGYNNILPVAKFENMDYSIIENNTNGLKTELDKLDSYSDLSNSEVRAQLDVLNTSIRQKTPVNVLITTSTYKPLIGMTSKTDSNGITTYYEYDSFGRLEFIKDNNGKILKHLEYHYKSQSQN